MNRIENKFKELKLKNKKALITYVTIGDPSLKATKSIVKKMAKHGADLIELGIPNPNPVMDGETIKKANLRALKHSINIKDIFNLVIELRDSVSVPLIFLTYLDITIQYGFENFCADCAKAGIDGIIIPDLPVDARKEYENIALKRKIYLITIVTPSGAPEMTNYIKTAKGFLYCTSSPGVTGERTEFKTDFEKYFSLIKKYTKIPTAIGFGISSADHIRQLRDYSDGLIIGSAIVKQIEHSLHDEHAILNVERFVKTSRQILDARAD